jgi:hypothetical protein
VAIALAALVVPEVALLVMMGGLDFTWLVLLSFLAPALTAVAIDARFLLLTARHCVERSLLARPPVFAMSAAFAICTFLVSGSLFATSCCLMPIAMQG